MGRYTHQWGKYKKSRRIFYYGMALYLPLGIIPLSIGSYMPEDMHLLPLIIYFMIFVILMIFANIYFRVFKCPRCGDYFFGSPLQILLNFNLHILIDECHHCGLKKYAEDGYDVYTLG